MSPKDFEGQLRHLAAIANRDGVTVRLVEAATSFAIGGWYLMNFERAGSVALMEHLGSSTFLFDEETAPTPLPTLGWTPRSVRAGNSR